MKDETYMFSIIVPIYNTERYLKECIESVLLQSYDNFELILINNGSEDGSQKIIDYYCENYENVKSYHIKTNRGISGARNRGIDIAIGKYIIFLDSDDYYCDVRFLEKAEHIIQKYNKDIVLFKCREYFDETGRQGKIRQDVNVNYVNANSKMEALKYLVSNGYYESTSWNKIYLRKMIVDNGLYFIDEIRGEDVEWYYRVSKIATSFGALDGVVHSYRVRKSSTSKTGWNKDCWNDIYGFLKDEYSRIDFDNLEQRLLLDEYAYFFYILLGMTNKFDDKKALIKKLKSINRYTEIRYRKKNKVCFILSSLLGYNIASIIFYEYIRR